MRRPLHPKLAIVKPKPVGWNPDAEIHRETLARFLAYFDMVSAWEAADGASDKSRMQAAEGIDPKTYARLRPIELAEAQPILTELLASIVAPPLPRPSEYAAHRKRWVATWNNAVRAHGWHTLPTICDVCGQVILVRGKGGQIAKQCCERCRHHARSREYKQRAKKKSHPS